MVSLLILIILGNQALQGQASRKISYDGFSVLELIPKTDGELSWIQQSSCRSMTDWLGVGKQAHLLCNRKEARKLKISARKKGISTRYISKHLGKEIKEEEKYVDRISAATSGRKSNARKVKKKKKKTQTKNVHAIKKNFRHRAYLGSDLMYEWLDQLDKKYAGMKVENIGKTGEGRDIKIVKINYNNTHRPIIFIDAGIHAREWISPAATLFLIEKLAKSTSRSRGKNEFLRFQWHIIPLANPDGYEYTRTKDRLWRKNTVKNSGSSCIGVDLNRNFPEGYGVGASKNPCSEVFQGPHPLSEVESRTISKYITDHRNIRAAISIHSYGNVLIYPWGYKHTQHPRKTQLAKLATEVSNAIKEKHGEVYQPGTAREVFGSWGLAGGATDDWYITQDIDYSYTFELPEGDEDGDHGFLLPAKNIVKVGRQLVHGFTKMAEKLS